MEFTGERFMPEVRGNIELEHLHRYLLARELAAGMEVLDIASGEGYGSAMLAGRAARVVGVDLSPEAVQHAQATYPRPNLEFRVGSCAAIPLPDASVDLVVSFETIEHHDQHEEMMREIRRVLHGGGVLIISSPDKLHYTDEPGTANPFHVKELYAQEFKELLGRHFRRTAFFGQRVVHGSAIGAESAASPVVSFQLRAGVESATPGIARPIYWIGLASDGELPPIPSGLLETPDVEPDAVRGWRGLVAERDAEIARLSGLHAEARDLISALSQRLQALSAVSDPAMRAAYVALHPLDAWRLERDLSAIGQSDLFDAEHYLATYADVRLSGEDPLRHYCVAGWRERRNPSARFDTGYYLDANPDVAAAGQNPLAHYILHGKAEGRRPLPAATEERLP